MKIAREEIFGPVASAIKFKDENDVVMQGNDTTYGLAAAVWTKDINRALEVARKLKAGTVWINTYGRSIRCLRSAATSSQASAANWGSTRSICTRRSSRCTRRSASSRTVTTIRERAPSMGPLFYLQTETRRGFHTSLGRGDPCTQCWTVVRRAAIYLASHRAGFASKLSSCGTTQRKEITNLLHNTVSFCPSIPYYWYQ